MDPLSDVLALLEPKSYKVGGFDVGGRFAVSFGAHEGIKCYAVISGEGWLVMAGEADPVRLSTGDCFLLPRGRPFRLATDLDAPAHDALQYIRPTCDGEVVTINGGGRIGIIGGFFHLAGDQAQMLLGLLPPIVHLRSASDRETLRWAIERMQQELAELKPGGYLIVQQLAHMILVQALRLHVGEGGVGWLFALSDKPVGAAIGAIHRDPARRWTVEALAAEVGMSRSAFAARFRDRVGEGPIEYLTRWRMLIAGRSLARGEAIGAVARTLGYESDSAFSTAFKRVMGSPPRRHARATAEAEPEAA